LSISNAFSERAIPQPKVQADREFGECVCNEGAHILPEASTLGSDYQIALHKVFVFLLVASGLAFPASFGFEHKNIKEIEQGQNPSSSDKEQHV
jgi:hypothetical protein